MISFFALLKEFLCWCTYVSANASESSSSFSYCLYHLSGVSEALCIRITLLFLRSPCIDAPSPAPILGSLLPPFHIDYNHLSDINEALCIIIIFFILWSISWEPPLLLLRMVLRSLSSELSRYLLFIWYFFSRGFFRGVFLFFWGTLFLFFLLSLFTSSIHSTCNFPSLQEFPCFPNLLFYSFRYFSFSTFHKHGTLFHADFLL